MEIELKIICGRDLIIQDIYTSDPYVVFKSNGKKYKTEVKKYTLNPDWKQKFKIMVEENEEIKFKVYDKDVVSKDDPMGVCIWKVPRLINNQKQHFILPNSERGCIVISAKCLNGGIENELKQTIDKDKPMIMKLKIMDIISILNQVPKIDIPQSISICVVLWTKYGKFETAINKMVSNFLNESGKTKKCKKSIYFMVNVQDILEYQISYKDTSNINSHLCLVDDRLKIPDFVDNERHTFHTTIRNDMVVHFEMKCIEGIYRNVIPELIPVSVKDTPEKPIPVEVFFQSASFIPYLVNVQNPISKVEFITNGITKTYNVNRRVSPYISTYQTCLCFDPFRVEAFLQQGCEINFYTLKNGEESQRVEQAHVSFVWPGFITSTDLHLLPVYWDNSHGSPWGMIVIQRMRLLSNQFKQMFSTDDNDLDGLILKGHNYCTQFSSCPIQ